mmetsp:Transcript_64625/g.208094  ORF Transcript_64625/g.208094 Transcript_64625/m.208094 type:complete len:254 (+) Transcript_64625:620-1381(+)
MWSWWITAGHPVACDALAALGSHLNPCSRRSRSGGRQLQMKCSSAWEPNMPRHQSFHARPLMHRDSCWAMLFLLLSSRAAFLLAATQTGRQMPQPLQWPLWTQRGQLMELPVPERCTELLRHRRRRPGPLQRATRRVRQLPPMASVRRSDPVPHCHWRKAWPVPRASAHQPLPGPAARGSPCSGVAGAQPRRAAAEGGGPASTPRPRGGRRRLCLRSSWRLLTSTPTSRAALWRGSCCSGRQGPWHRQKHGPG